MERKDLKQKNDIYHIERLGAFGEGIAKREGKTVFIKGALTGEEVIAAVSLTKKSFDIAELKNVVTPSPYRVKPKCKYFGVCGGCGLQHLEYAEQLRLKQRSVVETVKKVGGIDIEIPSIIASDKIFGYRNKLSFPVCGKNIGLYTENSHDIVNIDDCILQRPWNAPLIKALRNFMRDHGLDGKNEIRHIVAREKENSLAITLVAYRKIDVAAFADYLPFENFALFLNVNSKPNNVILGDEFYCIASKGTPPSFHPASFYQVNDFIADRLYAEVAECVKGGTVIDAYCGAGDLTLNLASAAKRVIGIDICAEAVEEAKEKARKRHILNADFYCGDCKKLLPRLVSECNDGTLLFDPPRKGLAPETTEFVKHLSPPTIVYISCNPATLARDLNLLSDDYSIKSIKLFDMFPNTPHVETLVVLSRLS